MKERQRLPFSICTIFLLFTLLLSILPSPTQAAIPQAASDSIEQQPEILPLSVDTENNNSASIQDILPAGTLAATRSELTSSSSLQQPTDAIEQKALRTRNSQVFTRKDGTGIAYSYTSPIHYQLPDGTWEPIDNTLIPDPDTGYGWRNAANDTIMRFAVTSNEQTQNSTRSSGPASLQSPENTFSPLATITKDHYEIAFQLLDALPVQGQVEASSIVYKDIYPDTDLRYWVGADRFKEDMVFYTNPSRHTITFLLQVKGGELTVTDEGAVVFATCADNCLFIAPPFLEDAQGELSFHIGVKLETEGNGRYQLVYELDSAWLNDPARAYPVVLDPTALPNQVTGSSMYLQQGAPTTATCNAQQNVYIGYDPPASYNKQITRGFFYFDLPTLPPGASISTANFIAYQYAVGPGAGGYNTSIYRPTQDWHDGSVCAYGVNVWTWNTPPTIDTGTTWTTGFVDTAIGWKNWNITNLSQQWFTGSLPNHGIAIYSDPENQIGSVFCAAIGLDDQCGQPANAQALRPYVTFEFVGPAISTGLTLNPSAQAPNVDIQASFTVRNSGPNPVTLELQVSAAGAGDFPIVTGITIPSGGTYDYLQSRQFTALGSFPTCAQYRIGGAWVNLPEDGGVACATLTILDPAPVQISTPLSVTPHRFEAAGGSSTASFVVRNTGTTPLTERFRARVTSGSVTFDETIDVTLNPNDTYTYTNNKGFSQAGIFEVIAEHRVGTSWIPLIGQGNGFIYVKVAPPPPVLALKGTPTTVAYCGDPVNSATGNYVSDFTDLIDPTPGVALAVTRWYNAIDAHTISGPFGFGTSWLYGMQVTWRPDKSATVVFADGQVAYYVGTIDTTHPSELSGVYTAQGKDRGTLTRATDGTALLLMPDQTRYSFNAVGQLIQIQHPYPATITVVWTGGRPTQLIHSAGVSYTISYTGSVISRIASSSGRAVNYTYSATGDLSQVTLPDGATYHYSYDANHRLTEARDPNNTPFIRNSYDAQGRVVEQVDQTGKRSAIVYGTGGNNRRDYTDALGNTVTHVYDAELRVVEEIDALGRSLRYVRDSSGNVTQLTDRMGGIWKYTYDSRHNLLTETTPLGNTTIYTYDSRNNLTSVRDPLGNRTSYTYDSANHLTQVTDALQHTRSYSYDARGNLIHEQNELGAQTWYGYNSLGLRTIITDSLQLVTRIEYDSLGNITRYTDAAGRVAQSQYDAQSRLTKSIDPIGTVIDFRYDPMGNLVSQTDGLGNLYRYTYDRYDRLIEEHDFRGNSTSYTYDTLGRRINIRDALRFTTVFTYNQAGELAHRQDKDGSVTTFAYDNNGQLVSETDALGRITRSVYDADGRQIELRKPCDVCTGGLAISKTSYDAAGRVTRETDPRGATTSYTYDVLGRLATKKLPNGGLYTYTYDPAGRLIQELDPLKGVTRYTYDALGRVLSVSDPLNRVTTNTYDAVGNLTSVTDALGRKTTYVFDSNDRQIQRIDALGHVTKMTYDAQGRLTSETDALGHVTKMTYDANGNQTSVTDRIGAVTKMEYNALNQLIKRTDALQGVFTTTYDSMGRGIATKDALGGTTATSYDVAGRRIAERDVLGFTRTYTYDSANNLIRQLESNGATTQYSYDAGGLQISTTNALGFTRENTYSSDGKLTASKDERGFVTRYEYDLLDRQTAQIDPLGKRQTTVYDAAGHIVGTTDYNGNVTKFSYDLAGNQVTVTDALGGVTTNEYDALNRVTAASDALGRTTRSEYNQLGYLVKITSPAGNTTSYSYDAEGRQIKLTDALGNETHTRYDALGRITNVRDALGRETKSSYDALGRGTANTDALGRVTRYSYDAAGQMVSITAPGGVTQRYRYDALGNLVSEQDGRGSSVHYSYDLLNRMTAMIYGANTIYLPFVANAASSTAQNASSVAPNTVGRRVWSYAYDPAGNQISIKTPLGQTITTSYDALNRLTEKRYGTSLFVNYSYDANGNRLTMQDALGTTSYRYDALNRLTSSKDHAGRTVQNSFDAVGQRTATTYPDGSKVSYAYNPDGALHQVTALDGGVSSYTLDKLNRPVKIAHANGVLVQQSYDAVGNLLSLSEHGPTMNLIARYRYTVDQANRRVQQIAELPQTTITTEYRYDSLDRLVTSKASDGSETSYSFDAAGNRIAETGIRIGVGVAPEPYQKTYAYSLYNELLRIDDSVIGTTTYSYNADGQRTGYESPSERARYSYDAEGHMLQAQVEEKVGSQWLLRNDVYQRYIYDGNGRRVWIDTHSAEAENLRVRHESRYDDLTGWDVLQSYDSVASPNGVRYLYDRPLHKVAFDNGSSNYFVNDGLGSVVGATTSSGALSSDAGLMRYGDYGEQNGRVAALPTSDGYTGYELDSYTGLNYARNRYYDAATGTFLSLDPWPADRQDLLGLHRYLYTQANPINNTDPLGLFNWSTNTVEQGDTLWGIASAIGSTVDHLLQLNPHITNRHVIYPGQRLNLPSQASAKQQANQSHQQAQMKGTSASSCGQKAKCGGTHIVQPGEYLSSIGAKYGVAWQSIYNANRSVIGNNPNVIRIGQRLVIPCATSNSSSVLIFHAAKPIELGEVIDAYTTARITYYPKLVKGKNNYTTIHQGGTWNRILNASATLNLQDESALLEISGFAAHYVVLWIFQNKFDITGVCDIECEDDGTISVYRRASNEWSGGSSWERQQGILTLAMSAIWERRRQFEDTLDIEFSASVANGGGGGLNVGLTKGPVSGSLDISGGELKNTVVVGNARWQCMGIVH